MRCFSASLLLSALVGVADAVRPMSPGIVDLQTLLNGQVSDAILAARDHPVLVDNLAKPARAFDGDPPPSLATILTNLVSTTRTYANELACLAPENASESIITDAFTSMDTAFAAALPQIHALMGWNASVVLASVDGQTTLTLSELATITKQYFALISTATAPNLFGMGT